MSKHAKHPVAGFPVRPLGGAFGHQRAGFLGWGQMRPATAMTRARHRGVGSGIRWYDWPLRAE
ncbi:MAG: hypothetical protein GKS06_02965 [Acidobacteria bacterium]|nr:hypothetical protein [Acidobacteriota bacterium]